MKDQQEDITVVQLFGNPGDEPAATPAPVVPVPHTPEPWDEGEDWDEDDGLCLITSDETSSQVIAFFTHAGEELTPGYQDMYAAADLATGRANLRRASLCVNACAGLSDAVLLALTAGGVASVVASLREMMPEDLEQQEDTGSVILLLDCDIETYNTAAALVASIDAAEIPIPPAEGK